MKSTEIKQRYQINFFFGMFRLSVLLLNSMSKLIHNRCTCKLIIKRSTDTFVHANRTEQLRLCSYALICFSLLFSSEIILKQLLASGSVNIVEYLNNRVFLLRNHRLIVAPRKFDVLKTNICPRSDASRANMLVLRTSNFQGQLSDR